MENLFSRSYIDTIYTTLFQRTGKENCQNNIIKFDKVKEIIEDSNIKINNTKGYNLSLTFARILTNPADLLGVFLILLYLSQTHFPKYQKVVGDYESKCPLISLKVTNATYANVLKDHVLKNVTFIEVNGSENTLQNMPYDPTKHLINDSQNIEVLILNDNLNEDIVYLNEPDEEYFNPKNPNIEESNKEVIENRKEIVKLLNDISIQDEEIEEDIESKKLESVVNLIHKYKFTYEFCRKLFDIFLTISLSMTFITSFLELLIMFVTQYLC
ncbi:Hypothetical protein SRAE_2000420900 [Strongyloides ratti]|uniref:Uncharacterized protein n=1 Tax=Strongyloides ratti TaxID=34506 RepID=A0A090LIB6_STRRB|nr:Hypothetical protein SRAE_2000420900 [Strongyloides ratti]CEF69561.1 Hypothetical protein SRAE_2000420900 [Strongyloides ratti]